MNSRFFRLGLRNLEHRRLRTSLTMVGIVIAISVIVALLFLGQAMRQAVVGQLQQFGGQIAILFPRDVTNPASGFISNTVFTDEHVDEVLALPGVRRALPTVLSVPVRAEFFGEEKNISLRGNPWEGAEEIYEQAQGFSLAEGHWPDREDSREIVVGGTVAAKGFRQPIRVGDDLVIRGRRFFVAGVLEETGEPSRDNGVFISLETLRVLTGRYRGYDLMPVLLAEGWDRARFEADATRLLEDQEDLEHFTVMTPEKAAGIVGGVIGAIELVLFFVASIAVVVGGIGVMNTMYTAVLERTREIGIMKAVGAERKHIQRLFLLEAGIIGLLGGAAGVVGGIILSEIIAVIARSRGFDIFRITIEPGKIAWILLGTLIVGAVAGVFPARRAAKLKPSEAIRYR